MCNLYSLAQGHAAIRDWFRARHDYTGNLPLFPGIFPDQFAPIVRGTAAGERELVMARWGMPGPPRFGDFDGVAGRSDSTKSGLIMPERTPTVPERRT
jgi:putative SOS response-associated peptidase YedK